MPVSALEDFKVAKELKAIFCHADMNKNVQSSGASLAARKMKVQLSCTLIYNQFCGIKSVESTKLS